MTETRQQAGDDLSRESGSAGSRRYLFVFLGVVVLYGLGLNAHWRFHRDSALYMGLARSLAETGAYAFNGRPHGFVWPGLPAMLAAVYATFGESFLVMNLLMSLFGLGAIAVWYAICPHLPVTKRQAFICFALFAFSRTLYYYSSHILADVPFTFFVLLGLWFGIRMLQDGPRALLWCAAASAAVCVACFLRPVGPCLLVALVGALWLRGGLKARWRRALLHSAVLAGPIVVGASLWAWRCIRQTGRPGTTYLDIFFGRAGAGELIVRWMTNAWGVVVNLSDAIMGQDSGPATGIVLLAPIIVGMVAAWRRRERILTLYGVAYLLAVLIADPGRRYLLPALPALYFWLVLGAGLLLQAASERFRFFSTRRATATAFFLVVLVLATNVLRTGKVIYQARSPDFYGVTEGQEMHDYLALANWLEQNAGEGDVVLAPEDRFLHYFSRVRTVGVLSDYWRQRGATYSRVIRRLPVTFVVRDPADPTISLLDRMLASESEALEPVGEFGKLRLLSVNRDELTAGRR